MRARVALLLAGAALAGCGGMGSREPQPPPVNLSGYSAAFKQGYADGCASAGSRTRRDEGRYNSETDYMMGWNDGNSVCKKKR